MRLKRVCKRLAAVAFIILYLKQVWVTWSIHGYVKQYKEFTRYDLYKETPSITNRVFEYSIKNDHICSCTLDNCIRLIIFICTEIDNFDTRNVLRKTWLSDLLGNTKDIRYTFLLGKARNNDAQLQRKVMAENEINRDILLENFIDNYYNLTLKTIMGLRWVSQECSNAQFVMKVDDDVYINIRNLLPVLDLYKGELKTSIGGYCGRNGSPTRDKSSKFYLSHEDYPYDTFPPYCSGTGYIFSISLAKQLFEVSKEVKLFPFEDVFIGFCLSKLGYGWTQIPGFAVVPNELSYCKTKRSHTIITLHPMSLSDIMTMWKLDCMHYQTLLYVGGINIL